MKSGILNQRDTYGMDPHLFVDPNLFYDSSLKDEAIYFDSNLMEIMQSSDTQLENIILNGNLCEGYGLDLSCFDDYNYKDDMPSYGNEYELENSPSDDQISPVSVDIGNYEEVITSNITDSCSSISSPESTDIDDTDKDSLNSSSYSLKSVKTKKTSKTGKITKRPKRVHDDRIKFQNKVAAVKYRQRKRTELQDLEGKLADEEDRNKILRNDVKELKMQIKIIKDLIGKHLPSPQATLSKHNIQL